MGVAARVTARPRVARAAGLENRALLQTDTDLDNLREDERFRRLLREAGK